MDEEEAGKRRERGDGVEKRKGGTGERVGGGKGGTVFPSGVIRFAFDATCSAGALCTRGVAV